MMHDTGVMKIVAHDSCHSIANREIKYDELSNSLLSPTTVRDDFAHILTRHRFV